MSAITAWLRRQCFSWRELFILTLVGIVANVYFLANYSPSIDDELAAVRASSEIWIAQGRFTTYLLETLLFPQASIPFSPYLFLALMLALTHMLLVRAHGVTPGWRSYAAYCLFVTYPTWWLIEEFSANVPATGIGFLLAAAALCLQAEAPADALRRCFRHFSRHEAGRLLAIGLLLALCAGAYQTLLLLFACGTIGVALCRSIQGDAAFPWRQTCLRIIHGGVCLVAGALLYFALNKLALGLSGTRPEYVAGFINLDNLKAPYWLVGSIALEAWEIYSGSAGQFGAAMPAAAVALACTAIAVARARAGVALPNLLLFALLLGTPFLLCLLTGPASLPLRAMVALPYVIWLSALLAFTYQRGAAWIAGLVVFALFQLQIVNLTSQYIATATLVQHQDRFMGFDIGRRLLLLRGGDEAGKPIWLDVYGHGAEERVSLFAAAQTGVTRGSFFGWDKGNLQRIAAYLRVLGFDTVRPAPPAARSALTTQFEQMPVWPHEGSLRRSGDYYLLKLGKTPDAAHVVPAE
ncbi:glucosyltransferase domain-containing protein [Pseudoduganella sp. SL102]|uniref:glucosyltransferase domain-containing protein n=1 Tax=Pseudoduganella sp. SL102 TaxID=2995154 RepID=UPI00248CC49E|nr:glucosyltransferase domain-containing protein [Pseudoduganella sp. SL102]WBS03209.1 glucosyltransferase domain-containing protein [Pseudoduganella sp. SL102]